MGSVPISSVIPCPAALFHGNLKIYGALWHGTLTFPMQNGVIKAINQLKVFAMVQSSSLLTLIQEEVTSQVNVSKFSHEHNCT